MFNNHSLYCEPFENIRMRIYFRSLKQSRESSFPGINDLYAAGNKIGHVAADDDEIML